MSDTTQDFAQIFIGRKLELEQFEQAISPRNKLVQSILGPKTNVRPRVFLPHGIGGIGKTYLSRKCLGTAKEAGLATIDIDWDRADVRPSDEIELMNIVAESLKDAYGEKTIQEYLRTQRQVKQVKDRVQRLMQENQEKWLSIVEATQNIAEAIAGEQGKAVGTVVSGVGKVVNVGADAIARAEDKFVDWLVSSGRLKGDESTLYKDEKRYLARKLMVAFEKATSNRPLVILFDTCEALSPGLEEWLRDGIVCPAVQSNNPIIFIISGRQDQYRERQADFGEGKIRPVKGYADRLSDPPPVSWDISRFADPEIAHYLRSHGFEPSAGLVDFVQELAKGVPYAVQLLTQAFMKLGIEYVKENFPPEDTSIFSAQEMVTLVTERFLRYCLQDEEDLIRIRGLAVLRTWKEDSLKAVWQVAEDKNPRRILQILQSRYSFILPERKLHEIIRDFIRQDLRVTDEITARTLGSRIAAYYFPLWENNTKDLPVLAERVTEPRWRNLTTNTLNALYWHDENTAIKFLTARVIDCMIFDINFAEFILELINEFRVPSSWFSTKSYRIVNILRQLIKKDSEEKTRALKYLLKESENLELDASHLAILYILKSIIHYQDDNQQDSLNACLAAEENALKSNDNSLIEIVAESLNKVGWKMGVHHGNVRPSEDALKALQRAVELQPNSGRLHISLGVMQAGLKKFNEALKTIQYGISIGEERSWAFNSLGNVYSSLDQTDEAIQAYKKAIELSPKSASPWNGLGNIYSNLKQTDEAIQAYNKAIELDSKDAIPWDNLGDIYSDLNRNQDAINAYKKAIELDPLWSTPWNDLGIVHSNLKQTDEAIQAYNKAIELDPKDALPWDNLGDAYCGLDRHEDAINAYKKAIELNPTWSTPWNDLGIVYADIKQLDDAIQAYNKAVELSPLDGRYWNDLGYFHRYLGRLKDSIAAFEHAIDINPKDSSHWNGLGNIYRDSGLLGKAIECFQKAIELDPSEPIYKDNLGNVYMEIGKYEEAIDIYMEMIQSDSESFAYVSLATCYLKTGWNKEFEDYIKVAQSLINNDIIYIRARIEAASNNIKDALLHIQNALESKTVSKAWIRRDPIFDLIRYDPRFKEIISEEDDKQTTE